MIMNEKVVGILGGMGPEATLDCFAKIIKNTPAQRDQDHLRVIIDCNPKVPDRTSAILGTGESPVDQMVKSGHALERAGADFIIIPCVSAHMFLDDFQRQIDRPVLSIFDAVVETIEKDFPAVNSVGLMATTGTVRGGLFQKRLSNASIDSLVPSQKDQERVMTAIYDIKSSHPKRSRAAVSADLINVAETLIAAGAQGIIAGCTEIPLALNQDDLAVPYFDSLVLLARAAIVRAGREPVSLP